MTLEGESAPDFTLESTGGGETTLSETLSDGPTVVLVNRGSWCSFCAEHLQTFSEVSYDLWFNDGVDILPVVTDELGALTEMRDRFDLDFQLLADPDGEVAEAFGVERTAPGDRLPRTTVVLADGKVERVYTGVSPDGHARDLLLDLLEDGLVTLE